MCFSALVDLKVKLSFLQANNSIQKKPVMKTQFRNTPVPQLHHSQTVRTLGIVQNAFWGVVTNPNG